jgi:tRNA dimethylallyltransferase
MKKPLLIIVGPTAVGKTELSIYIAKRLNGEIISADSMQIYKKMDIGSAKPTDKERKNIPHYLIDEIDPREFFSVVDFQKRAKKYIDMILQKNKLPIIVGGTGLYVNSIIYQMNFTKAKPNWELRKKLEMESEVYGKEYLYKKLKELDKEAASRIHPNNVKRVIRAIEVIQENGEKIKDFKKALIENPEYHYAMIGLMRDRRELYDRIDRRVDLLIEKGLIDEVRELIKLGLKEDDISMKGLGYKEIIKYLKGEYNLKEAVQILKRDTRHYAKRQITWFKRYDKIKWFYLTKYDSIKDVVADIIKSVEGELKFI